MRPAASRRSRTAFGVTSGRSLDSSTTASAPFLTASAIPRLAATFWPSCRGSSRDGAPSRSAMSTTSGLPATTSRASPAAAARIARSAFRRASSRRAFASRTVPKRCFAESRSLMRTMTHVSTGSLLKCSSAPTSANSREDLRAVQLEEVRLVVARSMEDQVIEPKLEVWAKLLDVLVWIVRNEPAAMGDILHAPSQPLHLPWIVDSRLVLGRKGQGRPDLGVLEGAPSIGVVRDLDLDHLVERTRVAAGFGSTRLERGQELVGIQLHSLPRSADETVAGSPRELRHLRASRPNVDRNRVVRPVVDRRIPRVVVLAVERHELLRPQLLDEANGLAQSGKPLLVVWPFDAERTFIEVLPRSDAEDHPVWVKRAEGSECLRDDGRVIAKRRRRNRGAQHHAARSLSNRRQPREGERRMPVGMTPRLKVIADEHA